VQFDGVAPFFEQIKSKPENQRTNNNLSTLLQHNDPFDKSLASMKVISNLKRFRNLYMLFLFDFEPCKTTLNFSSNLCFGLNSQILI